MTTGRLPDLLLGAGLIVYGIGTFGALALPVWLVGVWAIVTGALYVVRGAGL